MDHCRGHECTEADDIGFVFDSSPDDFRAVHVLAQVDEFKAAVGQQGAGDVLAEVMDITFDSGDNDGALFRGLAYGCQFFDFVKSSPHGFGGEQYLRQEHAPGTKVNTDIGHGGGESLFGDGIGIYAGFEGIFYQYRNFVLFAINNGLFDSLQWCQFRYFSGGSTLRCGQISGVFTVGKSIGVISQQGGGSHKCILHGLIIGIHDGSIKAGCQTHGEEGAVYQWPVGQAKGNIGQAHGGGIAKAFAVHLQSDEDFVAGTFISRNCHDQSVQQEIAIV